MPLQVSPAEPAYGSATLETAGAGYKSPFANWGLQLIEIVNEIAAGLAASKSNAIQKQGLLYEVQGLQPQIYAEIYVML